MAETLGTGIINTCRNQHKDMVQKLGCGKALHGKNGLFPTHDFLEFYIHTLLMAFKMSQMLQECSTDTTKYSEQCHVNQKC